MSKEHQARLYDLRAEDLLLASAIAYADFARSPDFRPALFTAERKGLCSKLSKLAVGLQALTMDNLMAMEGVEQAEILAFGAALSIESPPHGKALEPVIARLRDMAARRALMEGSKLLHSEAHALSADECAEKAAELSAALSGIKDAESLEDMHDGAELNDVLEALKRRIERPGELDGVPFGMLRMQLALDGLQPGRLVVIGGRPHQGKTTVALNIIRGLIENGSKPGIFSLEQTATQLKQGMLDIMSGVSVKPGEVPSKEKLGRIRRAMEEMSKWKWRIADEDRMTIDRICAKARLLKHRHGCDVIVVDYAQIVTPNIHVADMRMGLCEITGKLKALAKELGICVILLSQLNRTQSKTDPNSGKPIYGRPSLSGLKESASIESDADVVILIHRETEAEGDEQLVDMVLIIAKNRQTGQLIDVHCQFCKVSRRITENIRH